MATTREEERVLAYKGWQDYAPSHFENNESVLNAGVLLAIPALISQGLEDFFKVLNPLPKGFYGLHHMILTMCFMALCRIKNPEQLKNYSPGEFGKILGLDRIPEVGHFRVKLNQILAQSKSEELHKELFHRWVEDQQEFFFYIDGHVRVYHGQKANLPRRFVSREKLCLSGTTEFWVNNGEGLPLMVITGELNEKLKIAIEKVIPEILKEVPQPTDANQPAFTLIFDREAYEPKWFKTLWDDYQVAIISYRKNVKDKWGEKTFCGYAVQMFNHNVTMQLSEVSTQLSGLWFREIRKLSESGHQTALVTTHPSLSIEGIAGKIFTRWAQENFFKYMDENFDLDRMIEYGVEEVDPKRSIPNPEYRKLSDRLKKKREKKARLNAKIAEKLQEKDQQELTIEQALKNMTESCQLLEQLQAYDEDIEALLQQRSHQPARITVEEMPEEKRYNKLLAEGKRLKNAILMLAYRSESALYQNLKPHYKDANKDGRMLLKEIFTANADMTPDYENKTLTITLHSLSTPRATQAAKKLCDFLNETETVYPYTNMRLIYKTMAD